MGNHIIKRRRIRKSINATSGFVRPRLWVKVNCLLVARGRTRYLYMRIRPNYLSNAFQS